MFELTAKWNRNFGDNQNKNKKSAIKDNQNLIKIFGIKDKPQILHSGQRKYSISPNSKVQSKHECTGGLCIWYDTEGTISSW